VLGRLRPQRTAVLEAVGVLIAFTAVAVFATWPLAIHPLGGFYGFGNDNWGGMPYLDWLHRAYLGSGSASLDPMLQAPFGLEIPEHAVQPMDRLFSLALGGFGDGLGAYNAQIFTSFVLAGCTMYALARYVTRSRLAALIAGFAFTFSPFHLAVAMQYNALASIQWIPLFLLALLVLVRRGRKRDAVLTGAAFALVAATSYYYAWFVGWFTALLLLYLAVMAAVRRRRAGHALLPVPRPFIRLVLARAAIAVGVAVALAGPLLIPSARGAAEAGSSVTSHPINEAVRYSARPWMFFVPPLDNPIVGDRVRPWVEQHLFESPVYEQSIYLGYTLLALAAIAFLPSRRRNPGDLPERARFARGLMLAGAVIGILIMIGPYIPLERSYWRMWQTPGATTHLPSLPWLMFHLAPVFRFFTRSFVLVSACLAVLAAIGFARIERVPRLNRVGRIALAAAVVALIAVEFTNAPPHVWYSAHKPAWVRAVAKLPKGATVADYPIAAAFGPRSLYYMFWETKHQRATTNPDVTHDAQALAAEVASPDDPATGEALHRAGVDYAVVHTRLPPQTTVPYQPALPDDSMPRDAGSLNPWFQVTARTRDAVLYRIRSRPVVHTGAIARPADGFGAEEAEGRTFARWLLQPTGTLTLVVTGKRRRLALGLTVSSFARPRLVRVKLGDRVLASFPVPASAYTTQSVALGSLSAGRYTLSLVGLPGPQSIEATTGSPDPRSVSIRLREPLIVASPRER
jgi:hypothetical protein